MRRRFDWNGQGSRRFEGSLGGPVSGRVPWTQYSTYVLWGSPKREWGSCSVLVRGTPPPHPLWIPAFAGMTNGCSCADREFLMESEQLREWDVTVAIKSFSRITMALPRPHKGMKTCGLSIVIPAPEPESRGRDVGPRLRGDDEEGARASYFHSKSEHLRRTPAGRLFLV